MARLDDLCFDLIYVIFSHLQNDRKQLQHLSLTCRSFRDVSQQYLMRNSLIQHDSQRSRTRLFLRTIVERPDLRAHVRRLELDLLREDLHFPEEQKDIYQITRLLTNTREICYASRDYKAWHYDLPFPLKWAGEHAHDQVRKVEWHHNMTVEALRDCMMLPRIDTIYCRELRNLHNTWLHQISSESSFHLEHASSLRELRIGSAMGLPTEAFRTLLRMPRCLSKLVLDFHEQYRDGSEVDRIANLLEPVRETLEELTITVRKGMFAPVGHVADLTAFTALRKLSIPFVHILGQNLQESLRVDGLLPPRIHDLKLSFIAAERNNDATARRNLEAFLIGIGVSGNAPFSSHDRPFGMPELARIVLEESKCRSYHGDLKPAAIRSGIQLWEVLKAKVRSKVCIEYLMEGETTA